MTLTNLYMQNIQAKPASEYIQPSQSANDKENFGFYLKNAETSANKAAETKTLQIKKDAKADKPISKENSNNQKIDQTPDKKETDKPAVNTTESGKKNDTERIDSTPNSTIENNKREFTEDDFDKACKEIIGKLASELGIPIETIQQILISMNIKPLELQDTSILNDFVQELTGVKSSNELLNIPNVREIFSKIDSVMDEYEDIAKVFIQKIENDEIGKPKFIDAGRHEQPILASASIRKDVIQPLEVVSEDAVVEADEGQGPIDIKNTIPVSSNENDGFNGANQSFGNSGDEEANAQLTGNKEIAVNAINTNAAVPANVEFETTVLNNESLKNINTEDVINQIVEKIKVEVKGEATEIKVSLRPEHLGDVTLRITTQNGIVTAQFMAENQRVKEIIEAGFNNLRDSLQQQGINISQLSVSVGQENAEKQMEQFILAQDKSSKRINQIISDNIAEVPADSTKNYVKDNDVYDINVDYKA